MRATKRCSKCGVEKSLRNDFHRNRHSRDGYTTACKHCRAALYSSTDTARAKRRAYQRSAAGRAKRREYEQTDGYRAKRRAWYESAAGRAWRAAYAEKQYVNGRAWYESAAGQARVRAYYESAAGRAKRKAYSQSDAARAWRRWHYEQNAARYKLKTRSWRRAHRDRVLVYHRARRTRTRVVWPIDFDGLYAAYCGRCGICDQAVERAVVSWDHVVPLAKGGMHCEENLQPTHLSCNVRKGTSPLEEARQRLRIAS